MERVTGLLDAAWTRQRAIRLVGVGLSNLVLPEAQLALPPRAGARPALGVAIDAVRARFGYEAVRLGRADG
jgi:hypothetical protein